MRKRLLLVLFRLVFILIYLCRRIHTQFLTRGLFKAEHEVIDRTAFRRNFRLKPVTTNHSISGLKPHSPLLPRIPTSRDRPGRDAIFLAVVA